MDDIKMDRENGSEDSLGARLRKAREYKGLDLESVAHQLNLSQQRINDMENDDYRFAVAESYAKGYLRMYAKLLGLDPDLVVIEFDNMKYGENIQHQRTKLILNRQITYNDRWMRWSTYSIGAVLVFLVGIWWQSQPSHSDTQVVASESSDQNTKDTTSQTSAKSDQNLSEEANLLQKSDSSTPQALQESITQDLNKNSAPASASTQQANTEKADPKKSTATQAPAVASSTKPSSTSPTQNAAVAPKADAKAVEEESEEEGDEEESDEESTDNVQGLNLFKKTHKPKVLLGQRERDEQALLRELEKVFGRG